MDVTIILAICCDLLRLQQRQMSVPADVVSQRQKDCHSPLVSSVWEAALACHPNWRFANLTVEGLRASFRIGFDGSVPLVSATKNMPSEVEHGDVISEYIKSEIRRRHFVGPYDIEACPHVHINQLGVVLKGHTLGKWRIITDLSFPPEGSVNDGIDPALCSLSYVTVDGVASLAAELGRGTLLTKIDIESAYRLIPVHLSDRSLLGIQWKGKVFCNGMLPFGLRSAPKLSPQWLMPLSG